MYGENSRIRLNPVSFWHTLHIFCVFISKCQISLSLKHIIKIKFAQANMISSIYLLQCEACSFCYTQTIQQKSLSYTAAFPLALFNSAGT